MTSRPVFVPVLALVLLAVLALQAQPREFANVRDLGNALVEYDDGTTQAVAAYHYSQRNHDSAWLLVELGMMSPKAVDLRRDHVELITPSGRTVPLATQRRWGSDGARARLLLQQARPTRHQVRSYFRAVNGVDALRFFKAPEDGGTVLDRAQTGPEQALLGDLLFESPTGLWDRGVHALVIRDGKRTVTLPIELR